MENIILMGFMGAGKSTLGKYLAKERKCRFIDTDLLIEAEQGRQIKDIFAVEGEEFFRQLETGCLKTLLEQKETAVIAVGGGLPMREENQKLMKQLGKVVYLKARTETLVGRLTGDTKRPMLQGADLKERIITLMEIREDTYKNLADLEYSTDDKKIEEAVREINESIL